MVENTFYDRKCIITVYCVANYLITVKRQNLLEGILDNEYYITRHNNFSVQIDSLLINPSSYDFAETYIFLTTKI